MLPSMFANAKRNLIAGTTAVALLVGATSPALAWGAREQGIATGVLATLLVGGIILDANRPRYAPQPIYRGPVYRQPVYRQPVYYQPQPDSIYNTAAGFAFNNYSRNERLRIQSTLTNYGYYHGRIDGSFGPGTYDAVFAYARRTGKLAQLDTRGGAFDIYDGLLS